MCYKQLYGTSSAYYAYSTVYIWCAKHTVWKDLEYCASVYWAMCSECGACGAKHSAVFSVYYVVCYELGGLGMRCALSRICLVTACWVYDVLWMWSTQCVVCWARCAVCHGVLRILGAVLWCPCVMACAVCALHMTCWVTSVLCAHTKTRNVWYRETNNASSTIQETGSHTHKNKLMSGRIFNV